MEQDSGSVNGSVTDTAIGVPGFAEYEVPSYALDNGELSPVIYGLNMIAAIVIIAIVVIVIIVVAFA